MGHWEASKGHAAHDHNSRHSHLLTITKVYYLLYSFTFHGTQPRPSLGRGELMLGLKARKTLQNSTEFRSAGARGDVLANLTTSRVPLSDSDLDGGPLSCPFRSSHSLPFQMPLHRSVLHKLLLTSHRLHLTCLVSGFGDSLLLQRCRCLSSPPLTHPNARVSDELMYSGENA